MKKIPIISIFISLLLSTIVPIISSNEISKNIIYVDDDNSDGPWDGSMEHPYKDIQDGVDASVNGDMVYVFNGTYLGIISISKSIHLQGENPYLTIIDAMVDGYAINIQSDYVWINGFTITNTSYPPYVEYKGIQLLDVNNCTIHENIVYSTEGIALTNSTDITITSNTLYNNGLGILLYESSNNTITYNTIYENGCGISVRNSCDTMITCNTIKNNGCGIYLGGTSYDNMIIDNKITDNFDNGIEIYSSDNTINYNIIGNNSLGGIWLFKSYTNISDNIFYSNGITMLGSKEEDWTNHIIENNLVNNKPILYYSYRQNVNVPSDIGQLILAHCNNFTITNINLSNVDAGVQLGFSTGVSIKNNIIAHCNFGAIMLTNSSNNIMTDNIVKNSSYGILISYSSGNMVNGNTIIDSVIGHGITLYSSLDNIINENNLVNNYAGISLFEYSSNNKVSRNTIINNCDGIELIFSSDNQIRLNTIEENKNYGIQVYDSDYNNITENNFIKNTVQAFFIDSSKNIWSGNYWDDWSRSFPRIILGEILIPFIPFHLRWLNFDWHPARKPYDI